MQREMEENAKVATASVACEERLRLRLERRHREGGGGGGRCIECSKIKER